jgi:hypothetical protein
VSYPAFATVTVALILHAIGAFILANPKFCKRAKKGAYLGSIWDSVAALRRVAPISKQAMEMTGNGKHGKP